MLKAVGDMLDVEAFCRLLKRNACYIKIKRSWLKPNEDCCKHKSLFKSFGKLIKKQLTKGLWQIQALHKLNSPLGQITKVYKYVSIKGLCNSASIGRHVRCVHFRET